LEDGTRVRVAKVSGAIVPYPQLASNMEKSKEEKPDEMKVDSTSLCYCVGKLNPFACV
jgi:hypothetical protein